MLLHFLHIIIEILSHKDDKIGIVGIELKFSRALVSIAIT